VPAHPGSAFPLRAQLWKEVASRIQTAPGLFLFLDYDGTLTPLVQSPAQARPSQRCRTLLGRLASIPRVRVAVVSGRTVSDLDQILSVSTGILTDLFRIGVHGLEWARPGQIETEPLFPPTAGENLLVELKRELELAFAGEVGVILEDKGLSFAFHYRMANPRTARKMREFFKRKFEEWPGKDVYELLQGKKVIEVRPRGFNKGQAVTQLIGNYCRPEDLVVYAGDDLTDEDAFEALPENQITIKVGGSMKKTSARYWVRDPEEMLDLLEGIAEIRESKA
jgi:trehalose-phosphatase